MGTNGLGHSWPNIVVVAGKATGRRDEERGEEREKVRERERRRGLDWKGRKGEYHLQGKAFV